MIDTEKLFVLGEISLGEGKLRDEVIAFQNNREQLICWKLIGAGALAAVALGIDGKTIQNTTIVFGVIPLFIAYCDQAIYSLEMRIAVIATFLRCNGGFFLRYERFLESPKVKESKWWEAIQANDLHSSFVICTLIFSIGFYEIVSCYLSASCEFVVKIDNSVFIGIVLILSSISGGSLCYLIKKRFEDKRFILSNTCNNG